KKQPPTVRPSSIPDELLLSFTSTVSSRNTQGHTAHHRNCEVLICGVRRPDAVWHHPFGRNKYKYLLEQPTSLTGAGRSDLSIPEAVIPEEFHIVKNKGIQCLELYEEWVTCLQLEGLLELVKTEQKIYNIVFHEVIRQVTVGCAERGQLLAKLRLRYQSLLDGIPRRLMALHTEMVAQRAVDRRLIEEIHRIKASIQQLNTCVDQVFKRVTSKMMNVFLSVVQGYHQLYELHRARLEDQLLQITEDRDLWSQFTFSLALEVQEAFMFCCSLLFSVSINYGSTMLHLLLTQDAEDLHNIVELTSYWKEQLIMLMSQLKRTEHAQFAQLTSTQQSITKWSNFLKTQKK
uniref:Axonemal dynein light chain domain containing 1 n=1 Tax=Cyprinodon variegatus TaxID=28743 RepID=A0A3Q2D2J5_CYPVA